MEATMTSEFKKPCLTPFALPQLGFLCDLLTLAKSIIRSLNCRIHMASTFEDVAGLLGATRAAEDATELQRGIPPPPSEPPPILLPPPPPPDSPPPGPRPRGNLISLAQQAQLRRARLSKSLTRAFSEDKSGFMPRFGSPSILSNGSGLMSRFDDKERWTVKKALGKGGNGVALLVENNNTGTKKLRVCKVMPSVPSLMVPAEYRRDPEKKARYKLRARAKRSARLNEVYKLINMPRHDRIINFYEHKILATRCQLYFEYCDSGTILDVLDAYQKIGFPVPESFVWHAYLQLAEGLAFLHQGYDHTKGPDSALPADWRPVIHADLKPDNVFLRTSNQHPFGYPDIVIGDFGSASYEKGSDFRGTPMYQPPEIPNYSKAADIWSMAATIHEMCTNIVPMAEIPKDYHTVHGELAQWFWDREAMARYVWMFNDHSLTLEQCVHQCLEYWPENRPSAHDVVVDIHYEMECGFLTGMAQQPLLAYMPRT